MFRKFVELEDGTTINIDQIVLFGVESVILTNKEYRNITPVDKLNIERLIEEKGYGDTIYSRKERKPTQGLHNPGESEQSKVERSTEAIREPAESSGSAIADIILGGETEI